MWSVGTFLYSSLIEQPQEWDEELIKDFETPPVDSVHLGVACLVGEMFHHSTK